MYTIKLNALDCLWSPAQEALQDAPAGGGPRDEGATQLQHAGDSHRHGAEASDPEPPRVVGTSQRL